MLENLFNSFPLLGILADSFPKILIPGLTVTIPLTAIAFSCAMLIAVAAAIVQFARVPVATQLCRFYIWIFRGTPLLVQLFLVFYGLPKVGVRIEPFPAAVIVFSLNEGAYCAETVRAALEDLNSLSQNMAINEIVRKSERTEEIAVEIQNQAEENREMADSLEDVVAGFTLD